MTDLSEKKRVYEVLILRSGRWTVVDVHEEREDALDHGQRLRGQHAGVRVNIERFDDQTNTFMTTTLWEWKAPKRGTQTGVAMARTAEPRLAPNPAPKPAPRKSWWQRLIGR
ncbi:hypothetical protein L2U69_05195 [Zavarzinia compransoris]|uniref:hypothetical protein n=1 Tax=Zavarzinia marina TaxID=2911065 RepID=UPI001F381538|nr:hypothetical protein [Zavarzinia marina]MCF4165031.1 hypothetical protein [Zavarzinia marina]